MPKSPVREAFLAMRVRTSPGGCSVTCLLFDGKPEDLNRLIDIVTNPVTEVDWGSPIAFLILLLQDIGRTSENARAKLDVDILDAEVKTNSSTWKNKAGFVGWPADSYKTMTSLHQCHNNLVFVSRAVDMEIEIWRKLGAQERRELKSSRPSRAPAKKGTEAILNCIEFELTHTQSRKAQIQCLKERVGIQIQLVSTIVVPLIGRICSQTFTCIVFSLTNVFVDLQHDGSPRVIADRSDFHYRPDFRPCQPDSGKLSRP